MKRLIILAMHGSAGSKEKKYSPIYHWTADDKMKTFIEKNLIINTRKHLHLYDGLFWKGAIESAMEIADSGMYDEVKVICSKGYIVAKTGKWFAIRKIKELTGPDDETTIIPISKSLGGFDSLEVIDYFNWKMRKWRKKKHLGTIVTPFALMVDPDDFVLPSPFPARKIPAGLKKVVVVRQNNYHIIGSFMPRGLCGRKLARKNGSTRGVTDFCYPMPPLLFPDSDPNFSGREVNHWTIDEHMVLHGHPDTGTIQDIIRNWFNTENS